jgi:hypothetical protein
MKVSRKRRAARRARAAEGHEGESVLGVADACVVVVGKMAPVEVADPSRYDAFACDMRGARPICGVSAAVSVCVVYV